MDGVGQKPEPNNFFFKALVSLLKGRVFSHQKLYWWMAHIRLTHSNTFAAECVFIVGAFVQL